jgi:cysteine desulfurase/selenocysteine lyase
MNPEKIRQDFPVLRREINGRPIVYFDNACMTLKPVQVIHAMLKYYENFPACAGRSVHRFSNDVEEEWKNARETLQKFIGAKKAEEIVFTRNTTEGLNLVAHSLDLKRGDAVLQTDKEHNSNLIPWLILEKKKGIRRDYVMSKADGMFDLEAFRQKLTRDVKLVSMVHTSNLDGTTVPAEEIIKAAHDNGSLVMLDAAQSMPHKVINVKKLDVDFLAFSGHKMLGPTGTGVLYGKQELLDKLEPFITGGETVEFSTYSDYRLLKPPEKLEGGLQDYAGMMGLAEAARYLDSAGKEEIAKHEAMLNKTITDGIKGLPGLRIIGPANPELRSGIADFYIEGLDYRQIAMLLNNNANVMVRSGQHCVHSWFSAHGIKGSVRASLYLYNTKEECEVFIRELSKISKLK